MLSQLSKTASWLTRAGCGAAVALSVLGAAGPAIAQSNKILPVTPELTLAVREFDVFYSMATMDNKRGAELLYYFFAGLRTALMTTSAGFVAKGEKRRFCIPPDAELHELVNATHEELERDRAHWEVRKDESVVPLALQAFARNWPCP